MYWFAAKTKQRAEFKALDFFISMGINSYVPSYVTKRVWSDRIKKVTVPAIGGYVFFELNKIDFNLINLNPHPKIPFEPVSEKKLQQFKQRLIRKNIRTTVRYSKGQDVVAACGQLGESNLNKKNG